MPGRHQSQRAATAVRTRWPNPHPFGDECVANMMIAQISYDLVMEDEMCFVEGTYLLPDHEWQVFIFSPRPVAAPVIEAATWKSGVTGVFVQFPENTHLNKSVVEQLLGERFRVDQWIEVRGPDSIKLR